MPVFSGGGGGLLSRATTLTSADILALDSTPVTVVPAVAGKVIVPVVIFGNYTFVTTAYSDNGIWHIFNGPTFAQSGFGASTATTILPLAAAESRQSVQLTPYQDGGEQSALNIGQPLRVELAAAVTTGDGTGVVTIWYTLV